MPSLQGRIVAASSKQAELLQVIRDTSPAIEQLKVQSRLVRDLEQELDSSRDYLLTIKKQRKQQLHERNKQKARSALKLLLSCFHNESSENTEESRIQYFEILRAEHRVSIKIEITKLHLEEAKEKTIALEDTCRFHNLAADTLNSLYDSVFDDDDPTSHTIERDTKGQEIAIAADYKEALEIYSSEFRALERLRIAAKTVEQACVEIKNISFVRGSNKGIYALENKFINEPKELRRLRATVSFAMMWISKAQAQSCSIHDPPEITFARSGTSETLDTKDDVDMDQFDFLDCCFQINNQLVRLSKYINREIELAVQRANEAGASSSALEKELRDAKETLKIVRRKIFDEYRG